VLQLLFRQKNLPIFVVVLTNSELVLLLVARSARDAWARRLRRGASAASAEPEDGAGAGVIGSDEAESAEVPGLEGEAAADNAADNAAEECAPATDLGESDAAIAARDGEWRAAARVALAVCPAYFAAQLSFVGSLTGTSVTSTTVLSSTSCAFTLALSSCFLGERVTALSVAGVVLVIVGALLTGLNDSSVAQANKAPSDSIRGDALALFSALCYSVYSVVLARALRGGQAQNAGTSAAAAPSIDLIFGFIGLCSLLLLWPIVFALHSTGTEDLTGLSAGFVLVVVAKGLFDNILASQIWAYAVAISSPTLATVALSLTVPLAVVSDLLLLQGSWPTPLLVCGCSLTIAGFFVSAAADARSKGAAADAVSAGNGDSEDARLVGATTAKTGASEGGGTEESGSEEGGRL
jgi:drug/metabolite transporter (DMT)-like permease